MTIYFISGLAADKRLFENLQLPPDVRVDYLEWIEPEEKESFHGYCKRLAAPIDKSEPFYLAGVSFGGMACVEINKFLPSKEVILISSISTREELPLKLKLVSLLHLQKITPVALLKKPTRLLNWLFHLTTTREKELLDEYITRASNNYVNWSNDTILNWDNHERPSNLFHLHGTADRVFPIQYIKADRTIEGGGHFMVHSRAEEVSAILNERIKQDKP